MSKSYRNILVGINGISRSWLAGIRRIRKPNIILGDFTDPVDLQNALAKNIDYILPLSRLDYDVVSKKTDKCKILHPLIQTFDMLDSKVLFIKFMLEEFPEHIPTVYYLDNNMIKDIEFPVVSKPEYSRGGENVKIYRNADEFKSCGDKIIVQKFIDEEFEYGGQLLCIDGQIINKKIIRSRYPKYTIKTSVFPINYENVVNFDMKPFEKLVAKLNYNGGMCIDFKLDSNNNIKIFEINPRFGGSAFTNDFIYELLCVK